MNLRNRKPTDRTKTISICLAQSELDTLREAVALARPHRSMSLWIAERVAVALASKRAALDVKDAANVLPETPRSVRASVLLAPKVVAELQATCETLGIYQHGFLQSLVISESLRDLRNRATPVGARDERQPSAEMMARIERLDAMRLDHDQLREDTIRARVLDKGWTDKAAPRRTATQDFDVLARIARDPVLRISGWLGLDDWIVFRALLAWSIEDRAKRES